MNAKLHEESLRVTSIQFSSKNWIIFSGVPLAKHSYKLNSGRYFATIKGHPDTLPVQPVIGQRWSVKGIREIERVETGDYEMQQHIYESPEHLECSLPETGEQLIQFIAKEKDFKGIGESKARALWELLGRDFHATMRNDTPTSRARLSSLLSEYSIDALFTGYAKYKNLSFCNWMSERKIPSSVQQRLLKHHGEQSILAIQENPYLLIGFGMSFEAIDLIVANPKNTFDVPANDHKRLSAALEIAIRKEIEKGHTYTNHKSLKPHLRAPLIIAF